MKTIEELKNTIHCADCLEFMKEIPDKSIDLVLTDPPYGTTACSWDNVPDLEKMWQELKRIGKDNCAYVFTASQPFTTDLINSNRKWFKYEWVWVKDAGTGFLNAKKYPLKNTENIIVFCDGVHKYNPVMREGKPYKITRGRKSDNYGKDSKEEIITENTGERYPLTSLYFNRDKNKLHPTQKPVALGRYLVRTYTNEGDTVFDGFMGSGTTGVACKNLNRNFIGIELDPTYFEIAKKRIELEGILL